MDMPTAAAAAEKFRMYELMCEAIATLETPGLTYFYCTGSNKGVIMPESSRAELIRHFRKSKEMYAADIENL